MWRNMRKIFAIIFSCVAFTSALHADGCIGEPDVNRGKCGWYGRIDALGWKANQLGTQYAQQQGAQGNFPEGTLWAPESGFRGAFRVGGGYITECSGWSVDSYWTHFYQKSSITKDQHLQTLLLAIEPADDQTNSSANFSLNFNTVDLMLRKSFYAAPCFSVQPHIGLQGVWIRETENAESTALNSFLKNATTVKSDFNGVGIAAGMGINWDLFECLCGQWSLIGDSTMSLVTGKTLYSNHLDSWALNVDPDSSYSHYNYQEVRQIYDLQLGLRWESCLCNCFPLSFDLVWESMYLPNTFKTSPTQTGHGQGSDQLTASGGFFQPGDLSFTGVTLTCRLGF